MTGAQGCIGARVLDSIFNTQLQQVCCYGSDANQNLALERGEIVGVIGPNGSGKTTLLNVISGLERADSGSIKLDDRSIEHWPAHLVARAGFGRTFQNRAQSVPLARVLAERPAHRTSEFRLA